MRTLIQRFTLFFVFCGLVFAGCAEQNPIEAEQDGMISAAKKGGDSPFFIDNLVWDGVNGTGSFEGSLKITKFYVEDGALLAAGKITGTVTEGTTQTSVKNLKITGLPVNSINGVDLTGAAKGFTAQSCDILNLVIGPIFLDLLGLVVETNQIEIEIRGEQGPGNLLGNLLCAITGLLDPVPSPITGILNQIADLLNQIIDFLG